ncbi:MAG: hypothetical protein AAFR27_08990, partial [Pseudomonadota bacterium]
VTGSLFNCRKAGKLWHHILRQLNSDPVTFLNAKALEQTSDFATARFQLRPGQFQRFGCAAIVDD